MDFSMPRAQMLELIGGAMDVPDDRRSAFLGRFQHLQRLSLIGGINPGRGKAAEYKAHQVLVIAIAMQMLQLGLTPERAVEVIKINQDRVRLAIGLAVDEIDEIRPSFLWFDPAILTRTFEHEGQFDLAEVTFDYGGEGTGREAFERFFIAGWVQRMAFVSVSGTLWHFVSWLEGYESFSGQPPIGETSRDFLHSLRGWYQTSEPDSLM